jgi:hypothetical protein
MKLIIEFEADDLRGQDTSTPVLMLTGVFAGMDSVFESGENGEANGLTPDGRELKISWRVEK